MRLMEKLSNITSNSEVPSNLVPTLYLAIQEILKNPYPVIPTPQGCKKRASVACIVRIRPASHIPQASIGIKEPHASVSERVSRYFGEQWVQKGEPEILFIKRAAREGDRWTSQVALPGGKRDPEDTDDLSTSIRETLEEVGLDLTSQSFLLIGRLPGRIITTEWGAIPLMVLNPFVFLMTDPTTNDVKLQAAEIASSHWVPVRALLNPSNWTYERAEASDRFAVRGGLLMRYTMRGFLGHMLFGAIRLAPSESIFSSQMGAFPPQEFQSSIKSPKSERSLLRSIRLLPSGRSEQPLLLWGLTHGIIIDFLRLLPNSQALQSWHWPTFSAWDVRFVIWAVSAQFRRRKLRETLSSPLHGPFEVIEEGFASRDDDNHNVADVERSSTRPGKDSSTNEEIRSEAIGTAKQNQYSAVHYMLHGYFNMVQRGLLLSMMLRVGVGLGLLMYTIRRWKLR